MSQHELTAAELTAAAGGLSSTAASQSGSQQAVAGLMPLGEQLKQSGSGGGQNEARDRLRAQVE